MTSSYRILFMVEVLHDFFTNGKCNDFRFVPSRETEKLLLNCRAFYKTVGNKLIVLQKTDELGKAFVAPDAKDRFTFFMELMRPAFMIVSGIESAAASAGRYYFTNLHQNKITDAPNNDLLYLTKRIKQYDGTVNYHSGDLTENAGIVYECIKDNTGNIPPNADFWMGRGKRQYATGSDRLQFIPFQKNFPVAPAASSVTVSVFGLNTANNQFDVLKKRQTLHYESAVFDVPIDFSGLPEAKYLLSVNGREQYVYLSNDAVYQNMFAVVDLYNHLPGNNDFALADGAGLLKDQMVGGRNVWLNFFVRFANRVAYWKYVVPKKGVQSIDSTTGFSFSGNADPAETFTSHKPIPLLERPYEFKLALFSPVSAEPPLAPNPDVHASGMLTKNGADYYCNIYLNY